MRIEILGHPEQLIKRAAKAQHVHYASLVRALIYHGLEPDRGHTVTRPFGRGDMADCREIEKGECCAIEAMQ